RPATLCSRDRRDDGSGRHGGRGRRLHPRLLARLRETVERQLRASLSPLRRPCRRGARRARLRQGPVAPVVGGRRRRTNLNLSPNIRLDPMMEHSPLSPHADAREHLVVIGNGMAGCRAVEELLARDPDRYRVTIFGAEPRINYNRIMLSPVLAGEKCFDDIVINDAGWYADNGIALVAGDPVVAIDRAARTVTTRGGISESYDKLLIATGSDPFIIPVPGKDLPGVIAFRDMDD